MVNGCIFYLFVKIKWLSLKSMQDSVKQLCAENDMAWHLFNILSFFPVQFLLLSVEQSSRYQFQCLH